MQSGGFHPVTQITDFLSEREFQETACFRDFFRLVGVRHQIDVLAPIPHRVVGVAINRDTAFTAEEFALAELLQPHFVQAYHNVRLLAAAQGDIVALDYKPWRKHGLTRRECEVLCWIMEGKRNDEIAIILGLRFYTVKTHVERILARLGVETRTAAAARAREMLFAH
jgi:DNA-binding CsgD family transcriptional regulator